MASADTDPVSRYRDLARKLKAALSQAKVELAQSKATNDELQAEIAAVKAQASASPAASGHSAPAQSITRIHLSVDHTAAGKWYLGCTKRGAWTWAQYEALPPLLQDAELLDSYPCLRAGSADGSSSGAASGAQLAPALAAAEAKIRSLEAAFRAYRVRADMANARAAEEAESAAHAAAQSSQQGRLSTELSRLREEVAGLLSEKVRLQKSLTASQRALATANDKIARLSAQRRADPGESRTPPASPSARASSAGLPMSPAVPDSPTAAALGQGDAHPAQVAAAFSAYRARAQELLAEKDTELERVRAELRAAAAQATAGSHAQAHGFPGSPRPGSQLSAPQLEYLQTALAQYLTSSDASVRAQLERTLRVLLGLPGESVAPQSPGMLSGLTRLLG